ncbi:MAG: hypothetical protein RLZZ306_614 [Bacteroidota bacterium]|jgi:hypothetical protein
MNFSTITVEKPLKVIRYGVNDFEIESELERLGSE